MNATLGLLWAAAGPASPARNVIATATAAAIEMRSRFIGVLLWRERDSDARPGALVAAASGDWDYSTPPRPPARTSGSGPTMRWPGRARGPRRRMTTAARRPRESPRPTAPSRDGAA